MKIHKGRITAITFLLAAAFIIVGVVCLGRNSRRHAEAEETVYDIVLFTGQSNMLGSAWDTIEDRYNHNQYRYDGAKSSFLFSLMTGINRNILESNGEMVNFVSVEQTDHTAFEYLYLSDSLVEIQSTKMHKYGENLTYRDGKLLKYQKTDNSIITLGNSNGTNMIPAFCKTYYHLTGHKVIAVLCARWGRPLQSFLPQDDIRNKRFQDHIYEALKTKYLAALQFAEREHLHIGNTYYVMAQGESDIWINTTKEEYKQMFMDIHKNFQEELGIQKGVIVETSTASGTATMEKIAAVHQAQEELIRDNEDIILGSTYFYDRYVPRESDYANCNTKVTRGFLGTKLSYEQALERSFGSSDPSIDEKGKRNSIHFTSASLTKVGMDVAQNLAEEAQ